MTFSWFAFLSFHYSGFKTVVNPIPLIHPTSPTPPDTLPLVQHQPYKFQISIGKYFRQMSALFCNDFFRAAAAA